MLKIRDHIKQVTGFPATEQPIGEILHRLPLYIKEGYELSIITLYEKRFVLALKKELDITIPQARLQLSIMGDVFRLPVILGLTVIDSLTRKRLIEEHINFVVPGNQLYLPDLLMDLRERYPKPTLKNEKAKLLPSAQSLLIYHLLRAQEQPFKDMATKQIVELSGYTSVAVFKAIENLVQHGLCRFEGGREKKMVFDLDRKTLWERSENIMTSPVSKRIYVDVLPVPYLRTAGEYAIFEYSDLNRSTQPVYAITKRDYDGLEVHKLLQHPNTKEGDCLLEIWKYNPEPLARDISRKGGVDPLSLYLSLRDSKDERIEEALETIKEKYIW